MLRVDEATTTQGEDVSLTCGSRGATRPPVAVGALTAEPAVVFVVAGVRKAIRSINELVSLCSVCAVSAVSAKSAKRLSPANGRGNYSETHRTVKPLPTLP